MGDKCSSSCLAVSSSTCASSSSASPPLESSASLAFSTTTSAAAVNASVAAAAPHSSVGTNNNISTASFTSASPADTSTFGSTFEPSHASSHNLHESNDNHNQTINPSHRHYLQQQQQQQHTHPMDAMYVPFHLPHATTGSWQADSPSSFQRQQQNASTKIGGNVNVKPRMPSSTSSIDSNEDERETHSHPHQSRRSSISNFLPYHQQPQQQHRVSSSGHTHQHHPIPQPPSIHDISPNSSQTPSPYIPPAYLNDPLLLMQQRNMTPTTWGSGPGTPTSPFGATNGWIGGGGLRTPPLTGPNSPCLVGSVGGVGGGGGGGVGGGNGAAGNEGMAVKDTSLDDVFNSGHHHMLPQPQTQQQSHPHPHQLLHRSIVDSAVPPPSPSSASDSRTGRKQQKGGGRVWGAGWKRKRREEDGDDEGGSDHGFENMVADEREELGDSTIPSNASTHTQHQQPTSSSQHPPPPPPPQNLTTPTTSPATVPATPTFLPPGAQTAKPSKYDPWIRLPNANVALPMHWAIGSEDGGKGRDDEEDGGGDGKAKGGKEEGKAKRGRGGTGSGRGRGKATRGGGKSGSGKAGGVSDKTSGSGNDKKGASTLASPSPTISALATPTPSTTSSQPATSHAVWAGTTGSSRPENMAQVPSVTNSPALSSLASPAAMPLPLPSPSASTFTPWAASTTTTTAMTASPTLSNLTTSPPTNAISLPSPTSWTASLGQPMSATFANQIAANSLHHSVPPALQPFEHQQQQMPPRTKRFRPGRIAGFPPPPTPLPAQTTGSSLGDGAAWNLGAIPQGVAPAAESDPQQQAQIPPWPLSQQHHHQIPYPHHQQQQQQPHQHGMQEPVPPPSPDEPTSFRSLMWMPAPPSITQPPPVPTNAPTPPSLQAPQDGMDAFVEAYVQQQVRDREHQHAQQHARMLQSTSQQRQQQQQSGIMRMMMMMMLEANGGRDQAAVQAVAAAAAGGAGLAGWNPARANLVEQPQPQRQQQQQQQQWNPAAAAASRALVGLQNAVEASGIGRRQSGHSWMDVGSGAGGGVALEGERERGMEDGGVVGEEEGEEEEYPDPSVGGWSRKNSGAGSVSFAGDDLGEDEDDGDDYDDGDIDDDVRRRRMSAATNVSTASSTTGLTADESVQPPHPHPIPAPSSATAPDEHAPASTLSAAAAAAPAPTTLPIATGSKRILHCPHETCPKHGLPTEHNDLPKDQATPIATFASLHALRSHVKCHRTPHLQCSQCPQKFRRGHDLARHMRSKHDGGKPHECQFCGMEFARRDALRRHLEGGVRGVKCVGIVGGVGVVRSGKGEDGGGGGDVEKGDGEGTEGTEGSREGGMEVEE
ncbi:hypothetical protein HDU97_008726 [Phlyctochytrium planicorne]|nr:hypothetical protein HDU97_008726 [Phlyctochytrium planicorne]